MADFKIADIAKKLGSSESEIKDKIADGGFKIDEDSTVGDDAVKSLGIDPKHLRLDRRQEMLKKAMERHKRHPKSREVKVGSEDSSSPKRISKQDLIDRKKQLEKTIRKVDEHREILKDEQVEETVAVQETPVVQTPAAPVEKPAPVEVKTEAPAAEKPAAEKPAEHRPAAQEQRPPREERPQGDRPPRQYDNRQQGDRPPRQYNNDRPQGDRPPRQYDNRQQGDRPPRQYDNRPQGDRPPRQYDNRPQGDRPPRQYDNRPQGDRPPRQYGDRPQGDRPPYRPQGDRPQGDRPPRQYGDRPQGDRPPYRPQGDRPPYRPQGDKDRGDRPPYRPQGDRPPRPKPAEEGGALALEKKKILKDKPKTETVETKKVKAKAGAQKKEKNIHKGLDEGIELFELEQQILQSDGSTAVQEYKEAEVEEEEAATERKPQHSHGNNNNNNRKPGKRQKGGKRREEKAEPVIIRPASVVVGENIIVSELAKLMGVKATELIKKLMLMGVMASVNQAIDADTAVLLGSEYGIEVKVKFLTEDDLIPSHEDKPEDLVPRPPIVTVMGHVDHGKTSLLDRIRSTAVAEGEAGGITQHIGAYEVKMDKGTITFLDTPGHEAFTTLRARGASVTDVVILVVAADDGVMPQTKEAIDHAKAAGVKLIVAINKIDKENANPDMVRKQLADYGVLSEEWGGEYQFQMISAKQNLHIEDLLERVLLEAELLELHGNPNALAEGIVIESKLDKQKGAVATVLINRGTLKKGDNFVVGTEYGKVRAMFNYKGAAIKEAGLSVPVEIMGFSGVPQSGDRFIVTDDEKTARQIAELRSEEHRKKNLAEKSAVSLADLFNKIKEGKLKELNIVLKADVQGSLEALKSSLIKLTNPEVKVNIISSGVGGISENDVILASASDAVIIGFNVRPGVQAKVKAEQEGIELNLYSVIYQAIDDVKQAMEGMLDPSKREEVIGHAEVRQVFSVPKIGKIAGSYVQDGKVQRNAHVRVVRDSIVIYDGVLSSLKRFTDDAKEVASGYECGIGIDKYNDLKEGDNFEFYIMVEEKRTLDDVRKDAEKKEKEEAGK